MAEALRYAAFTEDPAGGNPAGLVPDATGLDDAAMQAIAAEVGYSETAFVIARNGQAVTVRYFTPTREIAFCGHATIALGVLLGDGRWELATPAGPVPVDVADGEATLTIATRLAPIEDLDALLAALRVQPGGLDPALPPRVAYGGTWNPVVAMRSRELVTALDYDHDALSAVMQAHDWVTVSFVHRRGAHTFDSRNPGPGYGIPEDPATGAAAAGLGGYLRELGLVTPPAEITVHQGDDMGRPSVLRVRIPASGAIAVSGRAVPIA